MAETRRPDPKVMRRLHDDIAVHLVAIEHLFLDAVKVSLLVRNVGKPDGSRDVWITSDTPDAAIEAIRQVVATGVETNA